MKVTPSIAALRFRVLFGALTVGYVVNSLTAQVASPPAPADQTADAPKPADPSGGESAEKVLKLEKFTVTGSSIPVSSYGEVGSPVEIVTAAEFNRYGLATKPTDFLKNIPANLGSDSTAYSSSVNQKGPQNYGGGWIDLRGLGGAATLVLIDGQRQTRFPQISGTVANGVVDVNSLMPAIAIKRVEVLKDGASAIYGSDAIAGVANFIPNDEFSGSQVRFGFVTDTDLDQEYKKMNAGFLFGSAVNQKVHVTLALEAVTSSQITFNNLGAEFKQPAASGSTNTFPGNFSVPTRNAAGVLTSTRVVKPDPDGPAIAAAGITMNPASDGSDLYFINGAMRQQFDRNPLLVPTKGWNGRASATAQISNDVTFKTSFTAINRETEFWYNKTTPPIVTPLVIPGTNPGNTFRAVNSLGQPLYAVPNPASPTKPLLDAQGNVVLTSNPTDPASGIPFNETVIAAGFRPYSTTNAEGVFLPQVTQTYRTDMKLTGRMGPLWNWSVNGAYSRQRLDWQTADVNGAALQDAINGLGGPLRNLTFNPFGNSVFATPGSARWNDPILQDSIALVIHNAYLSSLGTLEGSVAGEFGKLQGGAIGVAAGLQFRRETQGSEVDGLQTARVASFSGFGDKSYSASDDTYAAFTELTLPVMKNNLGRLTFGAALRYEKQQESGLTTRDPKLSFRYQKGIIRLRGSYATSFLVPTLFQRYGTDTTQSTISDPVVGPPQYSILGRVGGGEDLRPQSSKSYNFGASVELPRRLTLGVDFWKFEYSDLLNIITAQAVIDGVVAGIFPANYLTRDPFTNRITIVQRPFFNAAALRTDGVDIQARYELPWDKHGKFTFFANATKVLNYEYQVTSASAVRDGVGLDNSAGFGIAIPEWRAVGGVTWENKRHAVTLTGRYISKVGTNTNTGVAPDQLYGDLQYTATIGEHLHATLGVSNFTNNLPARTSGGSYLSSQLLMPRQVYVDLTYSF